jgi:hypothetical protein
MSSFLGLDFQVLLLMMLIKDLPGDTGADKDVMDALTYNASSLSIRKHLRLIMKGLIDAKALNIVPIRSGKSSFTF